MYGGRPPLLPRINAVLASQPPVVTIVDKQLYLSTSKPLRVILTQRGKYSNSSEYLPIAGVPSEVEFDIKEGDIVRLFCYNTRPYVDPVYVERNLTAADFLKTWRGIMIGCNDSFVTEERFNSLITKMRSVDGDWKHDEEIAAIEVTKDSYISSMPLSKDIQEGFFSLPAH